MQKATFLICLLFSTTLSAQIVPRLWSQAHFKYSNPDVMNGQVLNVDMGLRLPENTIVTRANWSYDGYVVAMGVWWNLYQGNGRGLINEIRPYVGKKMRQGPWSIYPRLGLRYFASDIQSSQFHGRLALKHDQSRWGYELWYQAPLNLAEHRVMYRFDKRRNAPEWMPDVVMPMVHWSTPDRRFWTIVSQWHIAY